MTKFYATVCLPPTAPRDVPRAIAAVLAPYDHNLDPDGDWNPAGEWDWWAIDSASENPYLVLPPYDGDRRLITASTVPRDEAELDALGPLECYGGPRGLLDFDAMRRRATLWQDSRLVAWHELTAVHPPARPLAEFVARHRAEPATYTLADAKREHLAQPLVQDVARRAVGDDPLFDMSFLLNDPIAYFARDHGEARSRSIGCAVPGSSLVTLDGTWTDADADPNRRRANHYLDALDADAVIVDVLCHC